MVRRLLAAVALAVVAALPTGLQAQFTVSGRGASLTVGGRVQAQYSASSIDAAVDDFFFRRVRLNVDLRVNDFLSGRVTPDFAGGGAALQDAYATLDFGDEFDLTIGQFKRSFDLFELSSSTDLSIIERDGRVEGYGACSGVGSVCSYSRLTEALGFSGRDIGVRVQGSSGSISWTGSFTNGTGVNAADVNDSKSASGRVTVALNDDVSVSGQLALQDYVDPGADDSYALAFGGDVELGTWRDGLHVQGGLVSGQNWMILDASFDPASFLALQGIASYYYPTDSDRIVAVEPIGRVSYADPDTGADDDAGLVITPGVMFYIMGRSKIGANLDVYSPQTGDTEYSFKVQTFLYF